MAHIPVSEKLFGIRGLMAFRPETALPLNNLVDALLRGNDGGITAGEREMIATYVSALNDCYYCQTTHGSVAAAHFGDEELVQKIKQDYKNAEISDKLKALLNIAGLVQKGGKQVTKEAIAKAREAGASDIAIHDTVLIAAAFCMFNRYVDGLDTHTHTDMEMYRTRGAQIAKTGYTNANLELMKL